MSSKKEKVHLKIGVLAVVFTTSCNKVISFLSEFITSVWIRMIKLRRLSLCFFVTVLKNQSRCIYLISSNLHKSKTTYKYLDYFYKYSKEIKTQVSVWFFERNTFSFYIWEEYQDKIYTSLSFLYYCTIIFLFFIIINTCGNSFPWNNQKDLVSK